MVQPTRSSPPSSRTIGAARICKSAVEDLTARVKDWAIIVSAGRGTRFGGDGLPKAFRPLAGLPMHMHSVRAFQDVDSIAGIVLYLVIVAIERAVIPWHASVRSQEP